MKFLDLNDMKAVVLTKKATILEFVEVVRFEIEGGKKKKISASNDELVQKIWDRLMGEAMNFSTEKELRRHLESVTREMLWLEANTEESDEIIRRLKSGDASLRRISSMTPILKDVILVASAQRSFHRSSGPTESKCQSRSLVPSFIRFCGARVPGVF